MPNNFLKETVASTWETMPSFRHVKIDADRLAEIADANALREFVLPRWDFPGCYPAANHAFPSHRFFVDCVNFCYDNSRRNEDGELIKFRTKTLHGKPVSGALAMDAIFYKLFVENSIDPKRLRRAIGTFSKFKRTFRGTTSLPLMRARWERLMESCTVLQEGFGGDVFNLLEEGDYRAFGENGRKGAVEILTECFPRTFGEDKFIDTNYFTPAGRKFYFYKRAQLFVVEYHDRAVASRGELPLIKDIEEIGPIADYELPKSYVVDGVLKYSPELQYAIERAMPIERHSQPEIEIRAALTWAHHFELAWINGVRRRKNLAPIHIGHLDYWRWERGRKNTLNHHLCFTPDY